MVAESIILVGELVMTIFEICKLPLCIKEPCNFINAVRVSRDSKVLDKRHDMVLSKS